MKTTPEVLVIEDDMVVAGSFEEALSAKGYNVHTVPTGDDALTELATTEFDLLFTHIHPPGWDGNELIERILARQSDIHIVMIAGDGKKANAGIASLIGVSGFMREPLSPEAIQGIAGKAMKVAAEPKTATEIVNRTMGKALKIAGRLARNVGLFIAAPIFAIVYSLALPAVGLYVFAKQAYNAFRSR
jgi:DNA-binding NtrC family response regulator